MSSHSQPKDQEDHKRLRKLVLGDDFTQKLEDSRTDCDRVADVISEAIEQRSKKDSSLSKAFAPTVQPALHRAINKDPKSIADAIFPIIMPAMRAAINTAISDMVLSLNQLLEKSLDPRAIIWRMQAWRSGKSYAEFILLKTMKYRVEQVLLIDRETSLVMALKNAPAIESQDPEQVSAMLSAISDFIKDSFSKNSDDNLETIRLGDFVLEIASTPTTVLAAAVRGMDTLQVKQQLTHTLDVLHSNHNDQLQGFDGVRLEDDDIDELMASCLLEQRLDGLESKSKIPWMAILFFFVIAIPTAYFSFINWQTHTQASAVTQAVQDEPGYVLTHSDRDSKNLQLSFIRSPLSRPFNAVIATIDHDLAIQTNESFAPLGDKSFFLPQVSKALALDDSYQIDLIDNTLHIKGEVSEEQRKAITNNTLVESLFDDVVIHAPAADTKAIKATAQLINQINLLTVTFPLNTTVVELTDNEELRQAVKLMQQLQEATTSINKTFPDIIIMGFSDSSGGDKTINKQVSLKRAAFVKTVLEDNGINPNMLILSGLGDTNGQQLASEKQRRVAFHVVSSPLTSTGSDDD